MCTVTEGAEGSLDRVISGAVIGTLMGGESAVGRRPVRTLEAEVLYLAPRASADFRQACLLAGIFPELEATDSKLLKCHRSGAEAQLDFGRFRDCRGCS